jgi:hypothetical protein
VRLWFGDFQRFVGHGGASGIVALGGECAGV